MKMKNKFLIYFVIILMILLINLNHVNSLGVTPGRTTVNFESGLEKDVEIQVLNNEHKNMRVMIMSMLNSDLNSSVTLFNDYMDFLPSEGSKSLTYKIKLPDNLSPGLHIGQIAALEVPKNPDSGSYVGATIAVVSQLYVYVPCPGKCIEADLNVLDSEQNGTATFIVPVISRGKLGIGQVRAVIDIYNSAGEKVDSVETDSQEIPAGGRVELSTKWKVNVIQGDYNAKVTVFYDGQTQELQKIFTVGVQSIEIQSIMVNNFQLGEIAKLQILVENKWNQDLKDVYANLQIYNHDDQVMADVKSAPEDLTPLSKKELLAYWDTVGVSEGQYNGKLMVKYGDKSTDKELVLKVSQNNLDVFGVGYAIKPNATKGMDITFILIVLVVILLVMNLAWFIFIRRIISARNKKKESSK